MICEILSQRRQKRLRTPVVLYESGFAPRWYVSRADIDESALTPVERHQTFCPYKELCSYYDIGEARLAAWSYREGYPEVGRISDLVSFEPDLVSVQLDGAQLRLEPGQTVIPHGPDRDFTVAEALPAENGHEQALGGKLLTHATGIQDGRASGPNRSLTIWLDYYP